MYTREKLLSQNYTWGKMVGIYEIGEYLIVEYKPFNYENGRPSATDTYKEESNYHPYINGNDTNTSYDSLDAAIVRAIAQKYDGCNTKADHYFMKAITN